MKDNTPENVDIINPDTDIKEEVGEIQEEEIINYTNIDTGLTAEEVASRVADGKINGEQTIKTKSVAQILRENILTFFNFVFVEWESQI